MIKNSTSQVRKLVTGGESAFFAFVEEHYDRLYQYALVALKAPDLAESVIEDSFLELWNFRHSLDPKVFLESHVLEIVERRVFHILRGLNANKELKQKIWQCIEREQAIVDLPILHPEHSSHIKSIQNDFLQLLKLHELTVTRS